MIPDILGDPQPELIAITKNHGTAKFQRGDGRRFLVKIDVDENVVSIREIGPTNPHVSKISLDEEIRRHCQELLPPSQFAVRGSQDYPGVPDLPPTAEPTKPTANPTDVVLPSGYRFTLRRFLSYFRRSK